MKHLRHLFLFALAIHTFAQAEGKAAKPVIKPSQAVTAAAQAVNSQTEIDRKLEVAYQCQVDKNQKIELTAMYGMKGEEVVAAQVRLAGITSPGMWRVADSTLNRFVSNDPDSLSTMWTTAPANASQIAKVDGGTLSYAQSPDKPQTVIVDKCQIDKNETAKLNRS